MNYEDIRKANETLKSIDVKGKNYVEVNQRIKGFRMLYPEGSIQTEILSNENGVVLMKASIIDDKGVLLGTGHALEKESSSYINKTSYIENCETSAIGRALGLLGYGIDEEFASADELVLALAQQDRLKSQSSDEQPKQAPQTVDIEITLGDALRLTTSKGKSFGECMDDQLDYIVEHSSDARKVAGAKVILKDRRECADLLPIEEAKELEEGLPF